LGSAFPLPLENPDEESRDVSPDEMQMMLPGRIIHFTEVDHLELSSILIQDSSDGLGSGGGIIGPRKSYQPVWADSADLQFAEILIDAEMLSTHIPTHTRALFLQTSSRMDQAESLSDQVGEIPHH
jgi:hypothetical protein